MVNGWGEVRSCLIIADPTFPPGYFPRQLDRKRNDDRSLSYSNDCYVLQLHHHTHLFPLFIFDAFDLSKAFWLGQEYR